MKRLLVILLVVVALSALLRLFVPGSFYTGTGLLVLIGLLVAVLGRPRART